MNQPALKSARTTTCSTKKPSKNLCKSANIPKKNLQNTLIKMNNPSLINGNNSILTQRNNTHSKCKGISANTESEVTARLISSSKKLPKVINKMKTDRKAQYTKLKAKQIENQISRKNSAKTKVTKKTVFSEVKIPLNDNNKLSAPDTNRILNNDNIQKMSCFLSKETHQISHAKKNSDFFVLSEIQKNQKQLLQKISLLEKQNSNLSQKQDNKFNQIRYNHDSQVNFLRQQMKLLHQKLNQQDCNNQALQKKVQSNEDDYHSLRTKLQQKQSCIKNLDNQNKKLSEQLYSSRHVINESEFKIKNFQTHISELQLEKKYLSEQLAKHKKEKNYIKQNCVQVLQLLRQEFGQQFKLFSD